MHWKTLVDSHVLHFVLFNCPELKRSCVWFVFRVYQCELSNHMVGMIVADKVY